MFLFGLGKSKEDKSKGAAPAKDNAANSSGGASQQKIVIELNSQEKNYYPKLWNLVNPEGLSKEMLKEIWLLSSANNETLDRDEFYIALRFVSYAQNEIELKKENLSAKTIIPLPKFPTLEGLHENVHPPTHIQKQSSSQFPTTAAPMGVAKTNSLDTTGRGSAFPEVDPSIFEIPVERLQKYDGFFEALDSQKKGLLMGSEVKELFGRSNLPREDLAAIWHLCDPTTTGCLDRAEFYVAVHLIALVKGGIPVPTKLPLPLIVFLQNQKKLHPAKEKLLAGWAAKNDPHHIQHPISTKPTTLETGKPAWENPLQQKPERKQSDPNKEVKYGLTMKEPTEKKGPGIFSQKDSIKTEHELFSQSFGSGLSTMSDSRRSSGREALPLLKGDLSKKSVELTETQTKEIENLQKSLNQTVHLNQEAHAHFIKEQEQEISQLNSMNENQQKVLKTIQDENAVISQRINDVKAKKQEIQNLIKEVNTKVQTAIQDQNALGKEYEADLEKLQRKLKHSEDEYHGMLKKLKDELEALKEQEKRRKEESKSPVVVDSLPKETSKEKTPEKKVKSPEKQASPVQQTKEKTPEKPKEKTPEKPKEKTPEKPKAEPSKTPEEKKAEPTSPTKVEKKEIQKENSTETAQPQDDQSSDAKTTNEQRIQEVQPEKEVTQKEKSPEKEEKHTEQEKATEEHKQTDTIEKEQTREEENKVEETKQELPQAKEEATQEEKEPVSEKAETSEENAEPEKLGEEAENEAAAEENNSSAGKSENSEKKDNAEGNPANEEEESSESEIKQEPIEIQSIPDETLNRPENEEAKVGEQKDAPENSEKTNEVAESKPEEQTQPEEEKQSPQEESKTTAEHGLNQEAGQQNPVVAEKPDQSADSISKSNEDHAAQKPEITQEMNKENQPLSATQSTSKEESVSKVQGHAGSVTDIQQESVKPDSLNHIKQANPFGDDDESPSSDSHNRETKNAKNGFDAAWDDEIFSKPITKKNNDFADFSKF